MLSKDHHIGIDFGTSNSCTGIYMNGIVKIAPNKIGERTTPSIVLFSSENNRLVGEEALNEKKDQLSNIVYEVKRFIGLNYEEFEEEGFKQNLNYEVENIDGMPKIKLNIKGKTEYKTAEEISSLIIRKAVQNAEDFIAEEENAIGISIKQAVITVPSHFNDKQKNAIKSAAKMAGIEVPRIINEPTAAAIAYGIGCDLISKDRNKKVVFSSIFKTDQEFDVAPAASDIFKTQQKVIVFDLGGGTFDITLFNISKNSEGKINFEIELTYGDIHLGGSDFDNMLINYCIKEFCRRTENDENEVRKDKKACRRLKIKCENAKKLLSIKNEAVISVDNFFNEDDLCIKISLPLFETICKSLFDRIFNILNEALEQVGREASEIDTILLVGGATRMCGIKKLLKKIFGEDKIKDNLNPDEAVAIGATLEAAKLEINNKMNFDLQDIIPYNLGIGELSPDIRDLEKGEIMNVFIKKFSKIPSSSSKEKTFKKNKIKVKLNIYEGNNKYVKDNSKIGEITINEEILLYKLKFTVDVDGQLIIKIYNDERVIEEKKLNNISHATSCNKKVKISKNTNMGSIAKTIKIIQSTKDIIEKSFNDLNKKTEKLKECCENYEELIENYMSFAKNNASIYEKILMYTKELFQLYLERIMLKQKNNDNIKAIIIQIKQKMHNLISVIEYVEELLIIFLKIRESHKNEFYEIFVNFIELLNDEGIDRKKKNKYSRYYCKIYFEKVFYALKKYVKEKDLYIIDKNIKEKYEKQKARNEDELKKVNSFADYIETMVKGEKFLFGGTGYTMAAKKIEEMKPEDIDDILDLFSNMADSYDKSKKSLGEAYCLANIININYSIYKIRDYDRLYKYIVRLNVIMEGREDEKPNWYKDVQKIIKAIEPED